MINRREFTVGALHAVWCGTAMLIPTKADRVVIIPDDTFPPREELPTFKKINEYLKYIEGHLEDTYYKQTGIHLTFTCFMKPSSKIGIVQRGVMPPKPVF